MQVPETVQTGNGAGAFKIDHFDENGIVTATIAASGLTLAQAMTPPDSKSYTLTIAAGSLTAGNTLLVSIPADQVTNANLADIQTAIKDGKDLKKNKLSNVLRIDLVADDTDDPVVVDPDADTIAAITTGSPFRVVGGTDQFGRGASGPFTLKITFSEQPVVDGMKIELKDDKHPFTITNGKITGIVAGQRVADATNGTGTDDMLHPYFLTIEPDFKEDGDEDVTVKLGAFTDIRLPNPNQYAVPDTGMLMITVVVDPAATSKDPDHFKATNDHIGANPRLKALPEKAVIPAGGYLVLAKGKNGGDAPSGIINSPAKPADKKTAAQKIYNITYEFGLPFPADDLSNFFRNGGTLQLLHTDIAGNTAGADGDKGYGGATTGAAVAGSVIISEIMWGLDGNTTNAQYIELHNTTAADIGIDKNEWVIAVGSGADTLYATVVDTVGNPGYWMVPGSDGVSQVEAAVGFPTLVDIVSMSRVMGGTDGTAAASWAASMRPSANLQGRRIGTPGAANVYVMARSGTNTTSHRHHQHRQHRQRLRQPLISRLPKSWLTVATADSHSGLNSRTPLLEKLALMVGVSTSTTVTMPMPLAARL